MRRTAAFQALGFAVIASVVLGFDSPARAAEANEATPTARKLTSRRVLDQIEQSGPEEAGWLERHVSVSRGYGLQYSHPLSLGDRELEFRVRGPVFKTMRSRRFGLMLELRF